MIGDIVGKPGRRIVSHAVKPLRQEENLAGVIANGENASGGSGLTVSNYRALVNAGVDCITLGDHIYRRREINKILNSEENIVKPANYPPEAPGRDHTVVTLDGGLKIGVISLLGRVFMKPVDCPWKAADRVLEQMPDDVKCIFVDFHAEATSDMQLMGRYLDGRVTAVVGTHTHVPTADECILPGGTAFQCDLGMTGPYDSILGRRVDRVLETTLSFNPTQFEVADDDVRLCGSIIDFDPDTGRATGITRIALTESEADALANRVRTAQMSESQ